MNKKILYVEISTAHTEILLSFINALTPEYEVHLLINEKSRRRVEGLASQIKISTLREDHYLSDILQVKKEFAPDIILLNSAQGRRVRDLCLRLLFDSTPIIGVHHNAENITKSFTQKIIHLKVKKYIVLADFIRDFVRSRLRGTRIQIESFYPLSFPDVKKIEVNAHLKYVVIPGVLEQDRRDYLGFISMVKQVNDQLDPALRFVLVGNSNNHDGPNVKDAIIAANLQSRFILFDHYVEDEALLAYVEKCFAIMPLMHPGTRWFDKYFETKISGAYSLAFAFGKKLLMHDIFKSKSEFAEHAVFYGEQTLVAAITDAFHNSQVVKDSKFSFDTQKKKVLAFIAR